MNIEVGDIVYAKRTLNGNGHYICKDRGYKVTSISTSTISICEINIQFGKRNHSIWRSIDFPFYTIQDIREEKLEELGL